MTEVTTDEREQLRDTVRGVLTQRAPMSRVRELLDDPIGYDRPLWAELSGRLGLTSLAVDERWGGGGFGFAELSVAFEELGRALYGGPFFASVGQALPALVECAATESAERWLPDVAAGRTTATLAYVEEDGRWDLPCNGTWARRTGAGWAVDGHKSFVVDGAAAGLLLVVARCDDGLGLFAVVGDGPGVARRSLSTLDPTRRLARVDLTAAPATPVGRPGADRPGLERALDRSAVLLAAELLGGAQRCLEMSVEYAKIRVQFGRPIGSFQAVKHKCADVYVAVEAARSAVWEAARIADRDPVRLPAAASVAKTLAADAFFFAAAENIQIHGGIGYTWDHDAHLYYKRAKAGQLWGGDAEYHHSRLADHIGA